MHALLFAILSVGPAAYADDGNSVSETVQTFGPVSVGQPMPTFAGYDAGDRFIRSRELLANSKKGLIVSFFATWCGPCKVGMPIIDQAALQREGWEATFVDIGEKPDVVKQYLAEIGGVSGTVVFDRGGMISKRYGVSNSLPKTFVIANDGTVKTIFVTEGGDFAEKLNAAIAAVATGGKPE